MSAVDQTTSPNPFVTRALSATGLASLADLAPGQGGRVIDVPDSGLTRRRLLEMGFCNEAPVRVIRRAPLGDPIEVALRGYHLSLRTSEAAAIQVVLNDQEAAAPRPALAVPTPGPGLSLPQTRQPLIAIAGNPNCGKTVVFNAMTGLRQKVANYPGVTVDKKLGRTTLPGGTTAQVIDLPGTYSLTPTSPDEGVATEVLSGLRPDTPRPDLVLVVLDASNLARNLYFLSQVAELDLPMVVALNMMDVAAKRGRAPDAKQLEALLGVPVVPLVATTGAGFVTLRKRMLEARVPRFQAWESVPALEEARQHIATTLAEYGTAVCSAHSRAALALHLLAGGELDSQRFGHDERIDLAVAKARQLCVAAGVDPIAGDIAARYQWIEALCAAVCGDAAQAQQSSVSERLDRLLLHPIAGLALFGLTMWGLFVLIFSVADPFMSLAEAVFEGPGAAIGSLLGTGLLHELWMDGIVAGVGGVLVFVPQIAFLFLALSLLEESGYLARGAFLLDRPLRAVGLHGKSFIPLLSSHACAIPGIMSARAIEHPRDRLTTMFVAPFMSCGARLPVYALLIAAFFGTSSGLVQGSILAGLYILGILGAIVTAWALRLTALKGGVSSFMIELSPYRLPRLGTVLRTTLSNVGHFAKKAGTVILAFSVLLWAALTFPRLDEAQAATIAARHTVTVEQLQAGEAPQEALNEASAQQIAGSVAGRLGHVIEPLIAPMGGDWKIGIGLIGAFAAREVFVGTMGVVYGAGVVENETTGLIERMHADTRPDGRPLWTPLLAITLFVWFAFAMQCISTTAIMRRETAGWRWPLAQLVSFNAFAWVCCVTIWQIGTALGYGG